MSKGRGCFWGTLNDSVWEDWGTLGNIRNDEGNHHPKNPTKEAQLLH